MIGSAAAEKRDDQGKAGRNAAPASRLSPKLRALVAKTNYEAPKVVAFPIGGMRTSVITLAGNL